MPADPSVRPVLGRSHAIIGMVHVSALPGTPRAADSVDAIVRQSVQEARLLVDQAVKP